MVTAKRVIWTMALVRHTLRRGIDGDVLDISAFMDHHPGGPEIISELRGRDASQMFADVGTLKQTLLALPTLGQANATNAYIKLVTTEVHKAEQLLKLVQTPEELLETLGAYGDFEAFKALMLAAKRGAALAGGPLSVQGGPIHLSEEEMEDGMAIPDLNLTISAC